MKHIPNILSGFRIVLIPLFVWRMMVGDTVQAGMILLISGVTDALDGNLARHFGWVSDLGKILDPTADKLTQTAVSLCLMIRLPQLWPFFTVMILKDLVMLVLGGKLTRKGVKIEGARWFGKVSTVVFYTVAVLLVFIPDLPDLAALGLIGLSAVCALTAALLYLPEYRAYRDQEKN